MSGPPRRPSLFMNAPPFRLLRLDHLVLRVRDLAAMRAFYCGVLGCAVERDRPELGLLQLRAGESLIDLVPVDGKLGRLGGAAPGAEGHNVDHLCLRVEPFDREALAAYLEAAGATLAEFGERYGADGMGPSQYLRDPEGNTIELKGPPTSPPVDPSAAGSAP